MSPKIIAIIPARGGSKGVKKKNIYPIAGKELIAYTVESALKSKYIDDVYVTSDSDEILNISKKYGALTFKRPDRLAQDSTKTEPVITNLLTSIEKNYDILILLQPTSPLRDEHDIDEAFESYFSNDTDSLISVEIPTHSPYKAFTCTSDGYLKGIVNDEYPFMPRQELPKSFYPNGAIYIIEVKKFLENNKLFTLKTLPFQMSKVKSMDIDNIDEVKSIEKIILG